MNVPISPVKHSAFVISWLDSEAQDCEFVLGFRVEAIMGFLQFCISYPKP